jgi:choline kinase
MTQPGVRRDLHVVVLAAGVGSRLSGTATRPKWLTPVGPTTIAASQLSGLDALAGLDITVDVVTGHGADLVGATVADRPETATLHNPQYATLNNWWSVLLAVRHRRATGRTGAMVVLNSDLWAPSAWFTAAVATLAEQPTPALVVDTARPLTDEAMKVAAAHGRVTAIGKVGVDDPVGEYTGALVVPEADLPGYEKALQSFVGDPDRANAWYEHAVGVSLDLGLDWRLVEAPSPTWVEIDDDTDLETARRLAAGT